MAQKSKPVRKVSSDTSKPSLVAKAAAAVKAAIAGKPAARVAKAPAKSSAKLAKKGSAKVVAKTPAKAAAPVKSVKSAKSAAATKPLKTAPAVEKPAEPQIAKAKAALKKETVDAGKPEAKARSRKISIDISPNEAAGALSSKWATLHKKAEQIEAKPYNMKASYEEKTAITHKVLGWGYILANRNDRLEVLFKDGIKYLISNYKP